MAESYSVEAVLSAVDKNFSSTMRSGISNMDNLSKATETATSTIGKIAAGIGIFKAVSAAVNLVESSVGSAISRIDTLNNANRTFENMGFSANDTAKMMDGLQASIKGLPTPLDQAVSGVELLAASTNDIGKSQKIWSAMNDGIIGFGGSTAQVQEAVVQLSQAFSNGKVDAATWNSMINDGLGPALNAIARQMGTTTGALKAGLSDGSISVGTFQDALINLDQKGGGGLKSLSQIAKDSTSGISTSIANAKTATTRGVADIIKAIDQGLAANHLPTIGAAISAFGTLVENTLGKVAKVIPAVITKITSFGQAFIPWNGILKAAGAAIAILVTAIMGASKIVAVQALFKSLKAAIMGISFNPVMLGVVAVMALAAILAKAYQQSTQLQDAVKVIGDAFNSVFGPAIAAAKTAISNFLKSFTGMDSISASINVIAESIGNTLAAALVSVNWTSFFEGAKTALDGVISIVRTIITGIGKMISAFVEAGGAAATWSAIVTIAQTVWTVISTIGRVLAEVIAKMVSFGATSSVFQTMGTGLASVAKGLNAIAPIIGTVVAAFMVFKTIVSVINGVLTVVGVLSKAFSALGTIASVVGTLLSAPWVAAAAAVTVLVAAVIVAYNKFAWFRDFVNSIPGTLMAAWTAFTTWFAGIWTTVVAVATTIWNTLVTVAQTVIAALEVAWTAIGPFFATLWQTIVTVATTIWNTLVTVFTTIVQMVMTVWNLIGPFFTTLWTGIVTVATTIWTGLSSIITALIPILEAAWALFGPFIIAIFTAIWTAAITIWNGISTVITTVMAVIQAVITTAMGVISALWTAAWGVISAVVSTIWNVIVAVVTTAINAVSGIITAILDVISGNWSGAWNAIKGVASSIWNGIKSVITSVINGIKGVITSVLNGIMGVWTSIWNGIRSVVSSVWNSIRSVISSEINAARSIISSVMSGIASTMSNIWNSIVSVVSSTFSRVVSEVSSGISRAYQAVTGYVDRMASAGADFVNGFVKGITGAIRGAVRAAANMAKQALNAAKSALGIHSPSRVMKKEVGYYTVAGMAVGILDNLKLVTDAAQQLASAAVPDTPTVDFETSYDASSLDNFMAGTKKLQSNLQAAVSSQVNYAEQKQFTVEVPVNLDGEEVARITAEPMEDELAKRSQRSNRIYGRRN